MPDPDTSMPDPDKWAEYVAEAWNQQRRAVAPPLVLLAEDDQAARDVLSEKLVADGFHVAAVADGQKALNFLQRGILGETGVHQPDLVISDVRMPILSGLELVEKIREISPLLPTILLTGFGDEQIRRHARSAGCNQVLFKPFDYDHLLEHAKRLLLKNALIPEFEPDENDDDWSPYH